MTNRQGLAVPCPAKHRLLFRGQGKLYNLEHHLIAPSLRSALGAMHIVVESNTMTG